MRVLVQLQMKQKQKAFELARVAKEKVGSTIETMKYKTLEMEGSTKKKAFKIIGATKERFGSTLQRLRMRHIKQQNL